MILPICWGTAAGDAAGENELWGFRIERATGDFDGDGRFGTTSWTK